MTRTPSAAERFLSLLQDRLPPASSSQAARDEAFAVLSLLPAGEVAPCAGPASGRQTALPAVHWLAAALSAAATGPESAIASAIAGFAEDLQWTYGYPSDPRWPTLGSSVAFTSIIGKSGLVPASDVVVGLTLLAPDTYYPLHAHPAVELYLVLAGTAEWVAGPLRADQPPGALILHPTLLPHAMQTRGEPLLALFTWRGDIASPSVYVE